MLILGANRMAGMLGAWRASGPAYADLAERIRLLVLDGRLPVGARLPAERELSGRLQLSRTTVSAAYARLREAGYLESLRGSGSVVRTPGAPAAATPLAGPDTLDLSKAALPAAPQLADAAAAALGQLSGVLTEPGYDPVGLPALRAAIAERYAFRGLPTDPGQIMVTIGAQHAVALLSRVLLERGDTALLESPTYPHGAEAIRAAGGRIVPVAVTPRDGWDTEGLEQAFRRSRPAMAYVMPDFHNPTGAVMQPAVRHLLLELAAQSGTVVVADETMAELDIDSPGPVTPLAVHGPAVLVGSLGKTVWGGLRIGWIRAEPDLITRLVQARFANDLGTPVLEQLVAVQVLARYGEILAGRRELLRAGRDRLESLLAAGLPEWDVPRISGGLSTWVNIGRPVSSQLTLAARSRGLLLAAGPVFGSDGVFERFLRLPISYGAPETTRAVEVLADAWAGLGESPAPPSYQPAVV